MDSFVPAEVMQQGGDRCLRGGVVTREKTLLGGSVAGSVSTAMAAVFNVLTTLALGSAACSFSARLEFG